MSNKPRNYDEEFSAIMNAMAESVAEMPDEEVAVEIDEGGYSDDDAEHVRGVLRNAVRAHKQRHLIEAQKQYDERIAAIGDKGYSLPTSIGEQRELLGALLASRPGLSAAFLTAQHREFKDVLDAEVESYLRQLQDLGALDELIKSESEKE